MVYPTGLVGLSVYLNQKIFGKQIDGIKEDIKGIKENIKGIKLDYHDLNRRQINMEDRDAFVLENLVKVCGKQMA